MQQLALDHDQGGELSGAGDGPNPHPSTGQCLACGTSAAVTAYVALTA